MALEPLADQADEVRPPAALIPALPWVVGGSAAAVLFTEIVLTRLFSVLLFYHFSFLAIAIALFGLAGGGLSAALQPKLDDGRALADQMSRLLTRAAQSLLVIIIALVAASPMADPRVLVLSLAVLCALPLFLLGKALALSLASGRRYIHRLYAVDLIASAAAALAAIPALKLVQGPAVLAVPALLALGIATMLNEPRRRLLPAMGATAVATFVVVAALEPGPLLSLRDHWAPAAHIRERWNAHSRVLVLDDPRGRNLVIDKSASTIVPAVGAQPGSMPEIDRRWLERFPDPSYVLGRPTRRVGVIGVGGGPDLLPALAAGATRIDGFELNGRILELLISGLDGHTSITRRPEIHLVHDEARRALQHSVARYDVLRANLVDTWAATAAGGFVLAENGLYTLEGWRLFLARLTPHGVLRHDAMVPSARRPPRQNGCWR